MESIVANPEPTIKQCVHKGDNFLISFKNNTHAVTCTLCHDILLPINKDNITATYDFQTGEKLS